MSTKEQQITQKYILCAYKTSRDFNLTVKSGPAKYVFTSLFYHFIFLSFLYLFNQNLNN